MQDDLIVRETRQLQVLGNVLRVRMLEHLCREPLTATQLGELMEMAPARAHYHLKQLVTVGLAVLIERRETSGIVEKYYRATARRFHLDKTVAYDPEGHAARRHAQHVQVRSAVAAFERHVQHAAEAAPDGAMPPDVVCSVRDLRLPPAHYERFLARLRALLLEFDTDPHGTRAGTQEYKLLLLAYPDTKPAPTDAAAEPPHPP
jgi:DNA-binding transcriptional ArsR family regulator